MATFGYVANIVQPEGKIVYEYNPLHNYRPVLVKDDGSLRVADGEVCDMVTKNYSALSQAEKDLLPKGTPDYGDQLNFDLEHPVDIACQRSYDGSVNLILNDNKNQPRLINTRFTPKENNTYTREDRLGNTDTNLYDATEFEIDSSLLKKYINIPKVQFKGLHYGGSLPVGNYVFYFKLSDADGNETDIVAESGIVSVHMGSINNPASMRGGEMNENSGKLVQFHLTNIDSGYDYVTVYYSRATSADNYMRTVQATRVLNRFRVRQSICNVHITGTEQSELIPVSELSEDFFMASASKTQAICQNMLFLGNVQKYTPPYETLAKISLGFCPYYKSEEEQTALGSSLDYSYASGGYYNTYNIYNKVGYWNEEIYRFGVVYILSNGSLSPVYNIRGVNGVPKDGEGQYKSYKKINIDYDTQMINETNLENSAGVCRIIDPVPAGKNYFRVRNFVFKAQDDVIDDLKKEHIKGYFFVRQKRIPTILCQAFMIGRDTFSGIPAWKVKNSAGAGSDVWVTESFLDSEGYVDHDYQARLVTVDDSKAQTSVGLCPEFELNQAYYNNLFTGAYMTLRQETAEGELRAESNHMHCTGTRVQSTAASYTKAKVISVPDSGLVRDGTTMFRNIAGNPNELTFEYISSRLNKPIKKNFASTKYVWSFVGGRLAVEEDVKKSKVKIVRGLYGPYLGIYKNNTIQPNSLVNIYIPGFEISQMYEYFKIRINCEDPYYPVSDRRSLSDFPNDGEQIFRGDCFISQFTHRLNRNFQDPDAPTNDTIVEPDTWRENYTEDEESESEVNRGDINAVRIGTYFTFKCYTTYNLAMRDFDRSYPSEQALTGNKRSFYPLSPIRVDGHSKIPESTLFNQGFASTTGERVNFLQPAVPFLKNTYQTRVIYSDLAQTDAFKNGFRVFKGISYVDYSNQYGGITKLVEWGGNLIIVFEHAVGLAMVNQNALIPTDDGTQIAVGAVKPLASTPVMISTDFGSQWPESICCSQHYIYGVDTVGKKIWRTDGKSFECISDFKVQKFLNDNITLGERELTPIIGVRNVKTHFNAYKNDLMFTYYDNTYGFEEVVWNLCYNEFQQAFTTFYSWLPSYSANIDNVYFSYDRNTSKWISKLAMSTNKSGSENGICVDNTIVSDNYSQPLYLKNRPLPSAEKNCTFTFTRERDHFGYWKFFDVSGNNLVLTRPIKELQSYMYAIAGVVREPIIPCIQLNLKCKISVKGNNHYENTGDRTTWEKYVDDNAGYYECQVFLTLNEIFNSKSSSPTPFSVVSNGVTVTGTVPTLENDFWKHGQAGIIDVQEKIKPCYWYHKQHPFEFEFIVGNDNAGYKMFDNLILSSNNVAPESFHYTIIGDSYDFSDQKPAMYFRQEATKAFYQYNGADMLYDHRVFDKVTGYIPEMITSSSYIERDAAGNPLRHWSAVSQTYRDTLFTWIYTRHDTFNEIENYYKKIVAQPEYADYPNITGTEVYWDPSLNQFSLCNHVKARDIKEVGRTRGNIQYVNDKWVVQITPINVLNRNDTWVNIAGENESPKWLPKLVVHNVPEEVIEHSQGQINNGNFPKELGVGDDDKKYLMKSKGYSYSIDLLENGTSWWSIANARKEIKLMDKYLKARIRYKGDKLAIIMAVVTNYNTFA
jgi:hypothetical protein